MRWPQASAVSYANNGMALHFYIGRDSQKAVDLASDDRLSLAVGNDLDQVMEINAPSIAADAREVDDPDELKHASAPLQAGCPWQVGERAQSPPPESTSVFHQTPKVISVLDCSKVFGYADLVYC